MSAWPIVTLDDDGIRPAGPQDACLYCQQKVGQPHGAKCITIKKRVKVRYIFELVLEEPHSWGKEQVEFHRNDGTWCANNAIQEIESVLVDDDDESDDEPELTPGKYRCLCPVFKAEYVEDVDSTPICHKRTPAEVAADSSWRDRIRGLKPEKPS